MADDAATIATGTRPRRADRRRRRRIASRPSARAQPAQGADRIPARQSAQPAQAVLRRRARRACAIRSASAASSSRSWCARAAPTASRSSPASGAGARRSAPACTRCRSSCSKSATAKRSSLRSSRTCSAADLNPLEEAAGYQALADEFNHTQDDIAKIVGKSRSHIANTLRLLKLPEPVKAYINAGKLTAGHARMLIGQPNAEELAHEIVNAAA